MSEEELQRKKIRVRSGHRASATRILNQVEPIVSSDPLDVPKVNQLRRSLEDKLTSLTALDEEILTNAAEDAIEDEIVQADEYKERLYTALAMLELALKPAAHPLESSRQSPPVVRARSSTSESQNSEQPTNESHAVNAPLVDEIYHPSPVLPQEDDAPTRGARVKLPKISLPRFNGDPVKWTAFWDSYRSAIHLNPELSEVDRFNYLRSLLEHAAYDAIAGLTLSSANYKQAIEILQKRFGNKQTIISKHMEILMNMETVASDRDLKGLRRLFDRTESHVRSLTSLGIESSAYGALLSPVLLSKLPPDLRLIVSRKVADSNLEMNALLTTFEQELTARERANPHLPLRRALDKQPHTASALLSSSQDSKPFNQCCYCQQPHPSTSCNSVINLVDRKHILKTSGRCFNCLRRGHVSRSCKSSSKCQKCNKRHHTSICDAVQGQPSPSRSPSVASNLNPAATTFQSTQTTSTLCSDNLRTVFLQTARAVIHHPRNPQISLEVRLLLDGGSQETYLSERARELLNLEPVGEQALSIATFGSNQGIEKVCPIVPVSMCLREYPSMLLKVYVVPTICGSLVGQPIKTCVRQYPHLSGLEFADSSTKELSSPIDLLIGSDYYWQLVTGSISRGIDGPVAVHTKLGWVLSGPSFPDKSVDCVVNLNVTHTYIAYNSQPRSLDDQLHAFWELEALGIQDDEKSLYDNFTGAIKFENGRYKVPLPWKDFHDPLPDNYKLSMNRLQGLLKRLRHSPAILKEYNDIIEEQLKKGIIEVVPTGETPPETRHYLPHHAVVRQDKSTTKVHVVYNASAKERNCPSLNDCLLKGPKFNQLIFDLLVRFRAYKIALIADLEKAFLMVAVEEADRDVLRFIWVDDIYKEPPKFKTYRFTRVMFGVSSSPFLLNATIRFHLETYLKSNEDLIQQLLRSTYVDDIISGGQTDEQVLELYTVSKRIFQEGGFNLRKFLTNSRCLQSQIDLLEHRQEGGSHLNDEPSYSEATLGSSQGSSSEDNKVLGVPWNSATDQLIFNVTNLSKLGRDLIPTKRNLVTLIVKFYDPLGFLSPVIVRFKILFQKLCQCKSEWDQVIPDELQNEWRHLISDLTMAAPMTIPRSYCNDIEDPLTSTTLYGFCDASSKAYAAVVYLVLKTSTNNVSRFVAAKTRVAPLRSQTIPRLELLSALLLSKLITSVYSSLKPQLTQLSVRCYTDSQVALFWILGKDKEWKPFVQNRVQEIRHKVHPDNWYHCPGNTNPADLPSRGLTMKEFADKELWQTGPEWLRSDAPATTNADTSPMPELCSQELKGSPKISPTLLSAEKSPTIGDLIQCGDFSDLQRLFRVTAYVLRAVNCFKNKNNSNLHASTALGLQELAAAEFLWIFHAQKYLVTQKGFHTLKVQLNLFLDEKGLWRCGGRLQNAEIPYPVKHPILLPRDHYLTTLIVGDAHTHVCHNGVKETLTQVRSKYWIVKGQSLTKAIVHSCIQCKKHEGAPYRGPPPPPYQNSGLRKTRPFLTQVSILLAHCSLELDLLVRNLSTDTFLRSLKRFAARRGSPRRFLSDNGRTFKAAAKFLNTIYKDKTISNHLTNKGSHWTFNVEYAPWWGGVFERMVRSTKRCLRKIVGRANLTQDELLTAVVEIEAVINSRPLSYMSSSDLEEPLTPSHLIVGRRLLNLPDYLGCAHDPKDEDFEVGVSQLTRRMKHLASVLNQFWRRWRMEYLSDLRETHYYTTKKAHSPHISEGDIVIVRDDALPRGFWKLGQIQEVFRGHDGLPRSALVRVATRNRQQTFLKRPIQLLYPLEVRETLPLESSLENMPVDAHVASSDRGDAEVSTSKARPARTAAKIAREKARLCLQELQEQD